MSASLTAGSIVGRYQVRSFLGAGGMGEVYLAWEPTLDREVALKILRPELTSDARRVGRFMTEARAASSLNHPSVVTIYEVGEEHSPESSDRLHYIAMERVEGVTLADWMLENPPVDSVLETLAQVADAVAQAHAKGIVHRDLKPENIMVSRSGVAKVLDFGIAKLVDLDTATFTPSGGAGRTLTEARTLIGTPQYRAPEQIEGLALDHRADIFALGCVIYECLTGRAAFAGSTTAETMHNIVHATPAEIRMSTREATKLTNRIVERCLAKDRDVRYDSARDLSHDLRDASGAIGSSKRRVRSIGMTKFPRSANILKYAVLAIVVVVIWATIDESFDQLIQEQRTRNAALTTAMTRQEQELATRAAEIERLRIELDESQRSREDLETSYRALLSDVSTHLTRSSDESTQLRTRVDAAERDLTRFREELLRKNERQEMMQSVERQLSTSMATRADARGIVAVIPGALFRTGAAYLAVPGNVMLEQVVREMRAHPALRLTVEGHTDSYGDEDENLELSQRRAEGVRDALVRAGVEPTRIMAIGRGEAMPAFDNDSMTGRMHNRRVELLFTVADNRG